MEIVYFSEILSEVLSGIMIRLYLSSQNLVHSSLHLNIASRSLILFLKNIVIPLYCALDLTIFILSATGPFLQEFLNSAGVKI
jgi:hypothetical protein